MRCQACILVPVLLTALEGCEHPPAVSSPHVPTPAAAAPSLSPGARARLQGTIDLQALDRLLATLGPEDRARFLLSFEDVEAAASGRTDVETRDVRVIIHFADPERQRLLERVWAPSWPQLPAAVLTDPSTRSRHRP